MKVLLRIMVVIVIIILIGFYSGPSIQENEILDNEIIDLSREDKDSNLPAEISDGLTRPKSGISVYVGEEKSDFLSEWGPPARTDPGYYNLEWMIYNRGSQGYMMVAVNEDIIRAIFTMGEGVDVSPYYIGQPIEEVYRFTMVNSEIIVENENGLYQFELSEHDLNTRLLVPFGDIFAQLFIDQFTGEVMGIYYLDKELLIEQRPYELVYRGDLPDVPQPQENQREIDHSLEQQIFEMTNVIRQQNGLNELEWVEEVAEVARSHSQNMNDDAFFANESPTEGTLEDRLNEIDHTYQEASENIASNYSLSHSVMHAWINSTGHRETLLDQQVTHLGVGVYYLYITQDFIQYRAEQKPINDQNASTN